MYLPPLRLERARILRVMEDEEAARRELELGITQVEQDREGLRDPLSRFESSIPPQTSSKRQSRPHSRATIPRRPLDMQSALTHVLCLIASVEAALLPSRQPFPRRRRLSNSYRFRRPSSPSYSRAKDCRSPQVRYPPQGLLQRSRLSGTPSAGKP